ncbi:MAG: phytanoyl-CoA dioxygenase family protein [Verrucomicrobia bacterium]|nr:phytanoyl-CoA dioxygenase family protein [Verrucomicrobiota bacterium]
MLNGLFKQYADRVLSEEEILTYHSWGAEAGVPHGEMLRAKNRHTHANEEIRSILINGALKEMLARAGVDKFQLWDEGLGWLAFRFIRPRPGDGYPFSCKNWGPAKQVLSVWLPIVGFAQELMIHLIPGSHLKEYPKYLPTDTHFTKDEYRLDYTPSEDECLRPQLSEGEALLFHPKTLHAEEIQKGTQTRFNLEFRIVPL